VRNASAPRPTAAEDAEILAEIARYVEDKIKADYNCVSIPVPEEEDPSIPTTSIIASADWMTARKLLLIVQNAYGSQLGIFSRSICFDQGISKGTWLPYIDRAVNQGYSIMLVRPNTNSVLRENRGTTVKIPIKGSESPEIHILNVWANVLESAENLERIVLLGFGNGASLCKDLFLKELVTRGDQQRIRGFITIEASHIIEKDDAGDIRDVLGNIAVNMESNPAPAGYRLAYRKDTLGCTCISLGLPAGVTEVVNVASTVSVAMEAVFKYLTIAETNGNVAKNFSMVLARDNGLEYNSALIVENPRAAEEALEESGNSGRGASTPPPATSPAPKKSGGIFSFFTGNKVAKPAAPTKPEEEKLTVADFDLLKIVGKGAFGKVMLVRKKNSNDEGKVYAMKVLKKDVIAQKGQIEHTKSERDILFEVRHPFIVRLRYAFQSEDKLYLVTDYYNGGTLFYHLRKSRHFTEERARFYAAELLLALDHLHSLNIIYRDLKLENVLMDHQGHLALTDFGLSKQNIDETGGASTFCGTAEYIAPELLRGQKYNVAVDWWSFGILLFEMMHGRTPFYDKNRKLMFYRIINTEPSFPPTFSPEACTCIRGLLRVDENERLGSGPQGAEDIKRSDFFRVLDFGKLYRREIPPPFTPEVTNELDTKYVPKAYLQAEARDSEDKPAGGGKKKKDELNFEQFTYAGDRAMDR
jgi:serum/glucocorticoid-regulated kinase 2